MYFSRVPCLSKWVKVTTLLICRWRNCSTNRLDWGHPAIVFACLTVLFLGRFCLLHGLIWYIPGQLSPLFYSVKFVKLCLVLHPCPGNLAAVVVGAFCHFSPRFALLLFLKRCQQTGLCFVGWDFVYNCRQIINYVYSLVVCALTVKRWQEVYPLLENSGFLNNSQLGARIPLAKPPGLPPHTTEKP